MSNDRREELCERFVAATASLFRFIYLGLVDDRKDTGQHEKTNRFEILMVLAYKGPTVVGEIAGLLGCSDYIINSTLRRLDDSKMIEKARTQYDRRVVLCELTPKGRKVLERIDHVVRHLILPSTETWSLEQLEEFVKSMESIRPGRE